MPWRWAERRHPNKGVRWIKIKYFKAKLLQREVSDEGRSQAIVILEADRVRIHIVHVLAESYRSDWSTLPMCPFPGVKRGVNAP